VHFIATRRLITFFTDSGILPGTGFFLRMVAHPLAGLLPEVPDERRLKDCMHVVFDRPDDWRWQEQIPPEHSQALLGAARARGGTAQRRLAQHPGTDSRFGAAARPSRQRPGRRGRADARLAQFRRRSALFRGAVGRGARFRQRLARRARRSDSPTPTTAASCWSSPTSAKTLQRIRKRALTVGTSLHLSYLLTRSEQSLERLRELVRHPGFRPGPGSAQPGNPGLGRVRARRLPRREPAQQPALTTWRSSRGLLAVRVTENAARSGEHYICETASDYRQMWRSAAGAGVLIGGMALLKIFASGLHAPLFVEAFLFSMIYGLGFVLIYPARHDRRHQTAGDDRANAGRPARRRPPGAPGRTRRLVDVVAAVCRSQLAAIAGNVMVALPVAIAIGFWLANWKGSRSSPWTRARTCWPTSIR
jgi:site-specific recombinase